MPVPREADKEGVEMGFGKERGRGTGRQASQARLDKRYHATSSRKEMRGGGEGDVWYAVSPVDG